MDEPLPPPLDSDDFDSGDFPPDNKDFMEALVGELNQVKDVQLTLSVDQLWATFGCFVEEASIYMPAQALYTREEILKMMVELLQRVVISPQFYYTAERIETRSGVLGSYVKHLEKLFSGGNDGPDRPS